MNKSKHILVRRWLIGVLPFFFLTFLPSNTWAQPWAKKAAGAVFTLKTFAADGSLHESSNGFFVDADGTALACFSPFKGACRAVVIDAQGKEWPVIEILGANDTYDVAKFKVDAKKITPLTLASAAANEGAEAWILPYSVKKAPASHKGSVGRAELFADQYTYYTIDMGDSERLTGCPLLNSDGHAIGLVHPSATPGDPHCYAVDSRYANSLHIGGLGINDPVLRLTQIDKAIPEGHDDALLSLFMAGSGLDSAQYSRYLDRFISKHPDMPDGYVARARMYAETTQFDKADSEMKQAMRVSRQKDETLYQYALLIFQHVIYHADQPYEPWTLDASLDYARSAYQQNPLSVYRQQQAQILFAQQKYDEAYDIYEELTRIDQHNAETFFAASQCKLMAGHQEESLALLDSAVNTFSKPYLKAAAPYLLARAQALHDAKKYRLAVSSYNEYAELMSTKLTANFYYQREQAEFAGHLYQQALEDINKAVEMQPAEYVYMAEKACVELRVGQLDRVIETAQQCITMAPNESDGYLFLGIAQCLKGNKKDGLQNLEKAKQLGNNQAQPLIDKYSK
ncbi:MAG: serine protease [Prevotella sp.]|nr:serine protease [Prevotella sp.]